MPRALCEGCGQHQPPDWKAGDLCSHCGKAVRHDVRCYWCAKWVPAAKFCRSCGAVVVEERLYGAARMLKDAGTDRFTIPKQLKEFDPDQIENFSRIYQRHAIAVARHVDEVRFLERFLRQKHWSAALEDQLIPQLPWNEETLARMSAPRPPDGNDLATVKAIQETSPFDVTHALASIARLRLKDWEAHKEAGSTMYSSDPTIRTEAALALTGWRVWAAYGRLRDLERPVIEELQKSPFKVEAAVRLGLLGRPHDQGLVREALSSPDPETAFGAAIVVGDVDRLQAALQGDQQEKIVAGNALIRLGVIKPVVQVVEKSPLEVQQELVASLINRKEPAPEAADMLMQIVETTKDETLRERAARILCRSLRPEWVLRIARAAAKDRHIFQSLLQAPDLRRDDAVELGAYLVQNGHFGMHQYGLSSLAENGRMPASFVAAQFPNADEETRLELLRFAEAQLNHGESEQLHKFVMNVVFGAHPAKLRDAAWGVLHRSYRHHGEHRGEGPFKLQKDPVERFFGSFAEFLPKLTAVLGDHATLKEVGYYEMMANLLSSPDDEAIRLIQKEESAANDLVFALIRAMREDYWPYTLEAMVRLLSRVASHPRWRVQALDAIRALGKKGNYHHDKAVRRLELAAHGIPEESEWDALPLDFAPSRFAAASPEGKAEFLKLVEHQLIHKKTDDEPAGLRRLLIDAALQPGPLELRSEALHIYAERMRRDSFPLRKAAVEEAYGSFAGFLPLASAVLKDADAMGDPLFLNFFAGLLDHPDASAAAEIASEGEAGVAFVRALLEFSGAAPGETRQVNLRRDAIRHLEKIASHPSWRDEVLQGLEKLQSAAGFDLGSEVSRVVRVLRPVEPPRVVPAYVHPRDESPVEPLLSPPPPQVIDYAERARVAQQMGVELQQAIFALMAGPKSPEEKMAEAQRMQTEFQAKVQQLYR